jgi:hypothetical protein
LRPQCVVDFKLLPDDCEQAAAPQPPRQ